MTGTLVISLDFELHWGGVEKWSLEGKSAYQDYFRNTRNIIPKVLELFAANGIRATWATVGLLMNRNRAELNAVLPEFKPSYLDTRLSAYSYMQTPGIGEDESDDPFHYGHSLVLRVLQTPGQELGSHTFSHYYCQEEGQDSEQFRQDLLAAKAAAARFGITPGSLVFPRNQFRKEYLAVCDELGFTVVRSNPRQWYWDIRGSSEPLFKRFARGVDAYLPGTRSSYPLESVQYIPGLPVSLPASRFLRPYNRKEGILNKLKLSRVLNEMTTAAADGEVYHLWWHPHNFGFFPEENMAMLNTIVGHFARLREDYGMESFTMADCDSRIRNRAQ